MSNDSLVLQIIGFLKEKDIPLIAHHIAKGIKKNSSLVDYHIKKLVAEGVLLIQHVEGSKYYYLQPSFYMEDAETAFMELLTPWVKEFALQTVITEDVKVDKSEAVINNLHYYFQQFLEAFLKTMKG